MKALRYIYCMPVFLLPFFFFASDVHSVNISTITIDGLGCNEEVVIHGHNPVFTWEYDLEITSFTVKVLLGAATAWDIAQSTAQANTNTGAKRSFITYGSTGSAQDLRPGNTYDLVISAYDKYGGSTTASSYFITIVSSFTFDANLSDLQVDFNNPFNPADGQVTKFRYVVGADSLVKVKIYRITGEYVRTLREHPAYADMIYTAEWDGTDYNGNRVDSGVYLVNLDDDGATRGIVRKVVVKNR